MTASIVERTFVMIKPDGLQRCLVGKTIKRLEQRGLKLVAMKMLIPDENLAKDHYREHEEKDFYDSLIRYICSGPVVAIVVEGQNVVQIVRFMLGSSDPQESAAGTIRGDFSVSLKRTTVHGSDSSDSAIREINLWFSEEEIHSENKSECK